MWERGNVGYEGNKVELVAHHVQGKHVIGTVQIQVLLNHLGVLDTELFIATLLKEPQDYTEWAKEYFDRYDSEMFFNEAVQYDKKYPATVSCEIV